jgi:hypothetical protein
MTKAAVDFTVGEHIPSHSLILRLADSAKPAIRQSYRLRIDGTAIVLEFGLRPGGLPTCDMASVAAAGGPGRPRRPRSRPDGVWLPG